MNKNVRNLIDSGMKVEYVQPGKKPKMTLTLKQIKQIIIGLSIMLILFAGWSIWNLIDFSKKKVQYEADKLESGQEIAALAAVAQHNYDAAVLEKKKADVLKKEKRNILAVLKKERKAHEELVEKIPEMVAEEVAKETRFLINFGMNSNLSVLDIYANDVGIQFTLVASKLNLKALYLLNFYATKQVPKMVAYIAKADLQIFSLTAAYDKMQTGYIKLETANKKHVAQDVKDAKRIRDLEKQLGRAKFKTAVKTGIAIGITYLVVRGIVKLVGK